jgi:two-component system chemotaxis response regulator CheB
MLKALIVDDSALYRKVIRDVLARFPQITSVELARNGEEGLNKIAQYNPDLVTLDIEMPKMSGFDVMKKLDAEKKSRTVLISSLAPSSVSQTLSALEIGAFDFIAKPDKGSVEENTAALVDQFSRIIKAIEMRTSVNAALSSGLQPKKAVVAAPVQQVRPRGPIRLVAIGVSTGGPSALAQVIPSLPGDLAFPIVIVQHMPPVFTSVLASSLNKKSQARVSEAKNGDVIEPGKIYLAPGGKQLKLAKLRESDAVETIICDDPPLNNCKPSVDYFFRSIPGIYGPDVFGMIMTGMGTDGVEGLLQLKNSGALTAAQDAITSAVYGMPMAAMQAGAATVELSLQSIAEYIAKLRAK